MNYIHHPYPFGGHVPIEQPMAYDQAMAHPAMVQSIDGYYYPHPPFEMMDFYHQPIMDYEEYAENLSRPRLTKEQVETLEAQFQAHPKPSSNVKRQLAAQTNLSLPRVANWFQNRRAKAKQQRRQEEFERMQKAKTEAEEAARGKSDSTNQSADSNENVKTPTRETGKASNPKQESSETASTGSISPTTNAAPATFPASKGNKRSSPSSNNGPNAFNAPLAEWEGSRDGSIAWSSRGSQEPYGQRPESSHQNVPLHLQGEQWPGHVPTSSDRPSHDAYSPMQYPMQQQDASLTRRTSSDELVGHLQGIDKSSWKEAGKELDLAARRKRPRPAAIGTSKSSSMLSAAASLSPNTRVSSYGGSHGIRQSKSAQSLNSRYAGVRKASAAQRSPLNFSTFTEAGSKADMASSMLQPITTTGLAPPTPMTPEDMHHLLPTSPSDAYCLSAQPTSQFFPTAQPMQINVASPPATPMTMDMVSSYPYQNHTAPPMSAPPHYTSFPEYPTIEGPPLTAPAAPGRGWSDAPPTIPSPEISYHSSSLQQPAAMSPIYDSTGSGRTGEHVKAGMSPSMGSMNGDGKFIIQEFPEQQNAHRFVSQQFPTHAKEYNFTNYTTPNDF